MKFALGFITALLFVTVLILLIIYTGLFSVSAMKKEEGITEWALSTTMESSVKSAAKDIVVPGDFNDYKRIELGGIHYKKLCEFCHLGPGVKETEVSLGLNPAAYDLVLSAKYWETEELFWITKNGIKMTGMPAWGITYSDDEIWNIIAFVKKLPELSPEDYKILTNPDAD